MEHVDLPKISIIIPIYKVEPYIKKCLDSIVSQTYKNLEIILVDDGSPDNCGRICDEYAAKDTRIKVIHKVNGGVSSARSVGLTAATGGYIGWVDPDDWIAPDMFEYLLTHSLQYDADITVCGRYWKTESKEEFDGWEQLTIYDRESALEQLLMDKVLRNYLWDKLFKADLFYGIEFPLGRTFEDVTVMHRLFMKAKKVICLPEAKYYYVQREDSIVGERSLKGHINHFIALRQRFEEMSIAWPQFYNLLEARCVEAIVNTWRVHNSNSRAVQHAYKEQLQEMANFSKLHYKSAKSNMDLGITGKLSIVFTTKTKKWAFAMITVFFVAYKIKHIFDK